MSVDFNYRGNGEPVNMTAGNAYAFCKALGLEYDPENVSTFDPHDMQEAIECANAHAVVNAGHGYSNVERGSYDHILIINAKLNELYELATNAIQAGQNVTLF